MSREYGANQSGKTHVQSSRHMTRRRARRESFLKVLALLLRFAIVALPLVMHHNPRPTIPTTIERQR